MDSVSKENLNTIKKNKGKIIGLSLKKDREFVLEKEGEEGLNKVEKEMEKMGYVLKTEDIGNYEWYPVQFDSLFLLLSKYFFDWDEEIMKEWGRWAAKTHFLARIMAKFFISRKKLTEMANRLWRKYYTQGTLEVKFDENNNSGIVEIKDFLLVPSHRLYLEGYFYQIASLVISSSKLKVVQVKDKDKKNHRFKITW